MENETSSQPENVISLFSRISEEKKTVTPKADASAEETFDDVRKKNEEVSERMRKERAKANRAVLRSYRIKT